MTKQRAKYIITDIFANAPRGWGFTNMDLYDRLGFDIDVSLKTVQNVTAGLKQNGGLKSTRDSSGSLVYTRTSKTKVVEASEFIF